MDRRRHGSPRILRPLRVRGRTVSLRHVQESDAEFILGLRLSPGKSRFLSPVDGDVEKQRAWIRRYAESDGQAYFIVEDAAGSAIGTVRIYDAVGDSFAWGSWIMVDGAPPSSAIESALLVYQLSMDVWGFRSANLQVSEANKSVLSFHEKFGARRTAKVGETVHLSIGHEQVRRSLARYARYLPEHLEIE